MKKEKKFPIKIEPQIITAKIMLKIIGDGWEVVELVPKKLKWKKEYEKNNIKFAMYSKPN